MSIILLRTLTRKSIIGFGNLKDLTVQNLIDMARHKELLNIYYFFRNIDFTEDIIQELKIDKIYKIDKKNKSDERYIENSNNYIYQCIGLILNENKENKEIMNKTRMLLAVQSKRDTLVRNMGLSKKMISKGYLKYKNQSS